MRPSTVSLNAPFQPKGSKASEDSRGRLRAAQSGALCFCCGGRMKSVGHQKVEQQAEDCTQERMPSNAPTTRSLFVELPFNISV